ncbi:uncharacterized protein LOC142331036 isoform X2 [Lycorma delicatula]
MLEDPIRTTVCGHTFCKKCINRVLKSDCKKKPCPLCNASLTHRSITSDEKTSTFLQLTVELITAINLDTGNNILEYRRNFQSTNEASQDSEKLFQPKGSHRSPLNNHKQKKSNEQNKAQNDNNNDVNEIINKKCKNDKTKINIKDYLTKKHKKIKDKKQSTINDHIKNSNEFKKPLKVGFEVQDNRIRNKNIQSSDCNNDLLSISDVEKQDDVNIDIVTNNEVNQITLEGDSDSTKCMVVDSSFVVYNDYIKGSIENKAAEDLKNKPSCNVPFILLGSLVGQHERMQKNNNLVQFVLCGSLNKERKKRKFDEYNDSIDENQQHRNCLVSFNHKRNLKQDLRNKSNIELVDIGVGSQNIGSIQTLYPPKKKLCSSTSVQTSSVKYNCQNGVSPQTTPSLMTDVDIFDDVDLNKKENSGINEKLISDMFDSNFDGLKSISQIPPQITNEKDCGVNEPILDISNDSNTVINESILANRNKITFCQREFSSYKSPAVKCKENISKSIIESSDIQKSLSDNIFVDRSAKSKEGGITLVENVESESKGDISVNEIENSEPVDHKFKKRKGLLSKFKQISNSSDLDKSVIRKETTGNNQHKMNSSSSSIMEIMGTQQRETLEKECTELRKKIEIAEKELENDASLKDNGIGPSNVTMIKEVAVKHNSRPTIIEASDNDDEYEDIEENISPTPPSVSKNSDLELNLRWQQSQRIVQMSPSVSEIVPDFETNEVPTSVNDSNFVKTYNSTVMNRSLNEIPSSVDLTDTDNSNKIKSPHINNKTNKLNVLPNLFVPSEKECSSSANHVEIAKLDGSEECVKINSEAPSSMSFVYSRLSDTQLKELKLFAFHLNADITNNITDGMTTHVIISPENGNRAPHTFKYLKGVASRLWVVSTNWISDSLKAGKLLPEEDYLVLDSSGEPGPLRCKQIDNPPPLSKFIVVPHPPYTSTTIEQVNDLIILCGGEIVSLDVLADVKYKSGVPRILLIDSESDNIMIEMWLEKFRLVPLNVEWLLEIAGRYMLVPISGFMIAPYPKLLLQYLSIPDELIDDDIDEDFEDCEDEGTNE